MVPKGWMLLQVSDICKLQNGNSFKPHEWDTKGLPIIRIQNLNGSDNYNYFSGVPQDKWLVEPGQLLFSWAGTKGVSFGPFIWNGPKGVLNQHIYKVFANENVHGHWLYLALLHITQKIEAQAHGFKSTLLHVQKKDIDNQFVLTPPVAEQKKIAQTLSTWDKAISVTEKLLANSHQQKKALMQQFLTGKKRLLDENGVRFVGKWEKKHLSDVADVYQPKTISQSMMSDSGYPVYGANGVIGFYQEFNHETEQIAVTCRGSTCGTVNWTQAKSWITGNAMVINTDSYSFVNKKFLFYTLNGSDLKYLISGSGQPQITGNIKTHIVNLPCIEEQQKIATVLSAADAEISTLEKKLACLKDEKKALMQQLLTGKRRVKVDAEEAVSA
ncbi:restriction endonuclease subunit S [Citrobacter freundii complex sp. 2024EL-00228]|jgi:type I restriction enzyme S subunit|uniref:Restriction endonuclease subunit S n=1 Tax=Citrobacter freundii TaxID=546 RepID=A0A9P4DH20_CITFR|nr:restriction endonuclease subunit S [Citrobacter freundii]EJC8213397.1 restriction endonuclease subunit S [Citrobacter freundii]ELK7552281.1 restriction endonuclease subunit S [Citrobacter freundii]MBJ9312453.1 restriction endonuclease subunit S [Citrobacter freundii]HAT3655975.1 restriction endonuclease subunit S [Citrobacter freundii]HAT3737390.1 restriction endonuclease subunit S [Citrobacter freundii]